MSAKPKKPENPMAGFDTAMIPAARIRLSNRYDPRRGERPKALQKPFEASIRRRGVRQAVTVVRLENDPEADFEIVAGRRRLAAALRLIKDQVWAPDAPIPALIVPAETADLMRLGAIEENVQREGLHPVDVYQALSDFKADGGDEKDAAAALGLTRQAVKQAAALGAIAEPIRDEWRRDKITDDIAKAFTICESHERQIEVFDQLKKSGQLYVYSIRQALGATNDQKLALATIGEDVYLAAGGTIKQDLFDADVVCVSDRALLDKLVTEEIAALQAALLAEGWSWALPATAMQNRYLYRSIVGEPTVTDDERETLNAIEERLGALDAKSNGARLTDEEEAEVVQLGRQREHIEAVAEQRAITAEIKAKSGCIIAMTHDGLTISYAMALPGAAGPAPVSVATGATAGEGDQGVESGPGLSGALLESLTAQMTRAVHRALISRPDVAVAALVAGLGAIGESPVKIVSRGLGAQDWPRGDFASLLAKAPRTMEEVANVVGAMIDMRRFNATSPRGAADQVLINAIGIEAYEREARCVFDADEYFAKASLARLEQAVAEMNTARQARDEPALTPPKGKKAEKAAWAAARAKDEGWIPPELLGTPF